MRILCNFPATCLEVSTTLRPEEMREFQLQHHYCGSSSSMLVRETQSWYHGASSFVTFLSTVSVTGWTSHYVTEHSHKLLGPLVAKTNAEHYFFRHIATAVMPTGSQLATLIDDVARVKNYDIGEVALIAMSIDMETTLDT